MLPSLLCPPLGARVAGCRAAGYQWLLYFAEVQAWTLMYLPQNQDGLSLPFFQKIHKLFSPLTGCFPGRYWAELIWLIPASLLGDNYATRPLPCGAFHAAQTCIWEEGCLYCVDTLLSIPVLLCPIPAVPQSPIPPTCPFSYVPNVTFLLCPVLLSSYPPVEQLLLQQM